MPRMRVGGSSRRPPAQAENFLVKLMAYLSGSREDISEYIRWDWTGRIIVIPDEQKLVERVCKVLFNQQKLTSFDKQMNNWGFTRLTPTQKKPLVSAFGLRPNPSPLDFPFTANMRMWQHKGGLGKDSTSAEIETVARHEDGIARRKKSLAVRTAKTETPPSEEDRDAVGMLWSEDPILDNGAGKAEAAKEEEQMEVDVVEGARGLSQLNWAPPPPPGAVAEGMEDSGKYYHPAVHAAHPDDSTSAHHALGDHEPPVSHQRSPLSPSHQLVSQPSRFEPYNIQHRRASCPSIPSRSLISPSFDLSQSPYRVEMASYNLPAFEASSVIPVDMQVDSPPARPSPPLHSTSEGQPSSHQSTSASPPIDLDHSPPSPPFLHPPPRPTYTASLTAAACVTPLPPPHPAVSSAFAELEERRRAAATAMERATLYAPRDSLGSTSGSGSGEEGSQSQSQSQSQSSQELKRQMKKQAGQYQQGGKVVGEGGGRRALVPKESWSEYCPPEGGEGLFPDAVREPLRVLDVE